MERKELVTPKLYSPKKFDSPTALGIKTGNVVYTSGQLAWDTERQIVGIGDVSAQTRQALENVKAVLQAGGAVLTDVVKMTFYLTDIRHKEAVWAVRREFFHDFRPAASLVEVSHLVDPNALLEVEAIAYVGLSTT